MGAATPTSNCYTHSHSLSTLLKSSSKFEVLQKKGEANIITFLRGLEAAPSLSRERKLSLKHLLYTVNIMRIRVKGYICLDGGY